MEESQLSLPPAVVALSAEIDDLLRSLRHRGFVDLESFNHRFKCLCDQIGNFNGLTPAVAGEVKRNRAKLVLARRIAKKRVALINDGIDRLTVLGRNLRTHPP